MPTLLGGDRANFAAAASASENDDDDSILCHLVFNPVDRLSYLYLPAQ